MQYLTPEEIKAAHRETHEKLQRPLPLRGRCVSIFDRFIMDRNARILEYGPGTGKFVNLLSEKGFRNLSGCDLDDYLVPEVKAKMADFATLDLSFDRLPWEDASYDVVMAWEVLEHVENPHHAIREAVRVLRPGGLFFMSVPNIFNIISRLVFLRRGLFPNYSERNNHITLFPRGIFEKTVLRYFDCAEVGYVGSRMNVPFLRRITFLPENEWFGRWVYYVLRKK